MAKIPLKSKKDIEMMKTACIAAAEILDEVEAILAPGITTEAIDIFVHQKTIEKGGTPATLNYRGYPKSCCVSPNEVVCHGIPGPFIKLKDGDIVNIDVTVIKNGFHGDTSRMYKIGKTSEAANILIDITKEAMMVGIREVAPNKRTGDIGAAIQEYIASTGKNYGIVREYTGHGLGRAFHEAPQIIHVGKRGTGEIMKPGMTFTVEPMINEGVAKTVLSSLDGWTVRTADGKLSAQWEHTVLVTETGYEILTLGKNGA